MIKCYICGKEAKNKNMCEDCYLFVKALHYNYTTKQLMLMFSHVLGAKLVEELSNNITDALAEQYDRGV